MKRTPKAVLEASLTPIEDGEVIVSELTEEEMTLLAKTVEAAKAHNLLKKGLLDRFALEWEHSEMWTRIKERLGRTDQRKVVIRKVVKFVVVVPKE